MLARIDDRLLRVSIEVNGRLKIYEGLNILVTGTKYANPLQNDCQIKIFNLDKDTVDYLVSQTSPYRGGSSRVIVEAGRISTGYFKVFEGDVTASAPTQPPDVGLTLKSLEMDSQKGNVVARSGPGIAPLSVIARGVAEDLGIPLEFQATEKNLANYTYTGAALKQVGVLSDAGKVDVYVDGGRLVVKDASVPLRNTLRVLNMDTGLIGEPEVTEEGLKLKFLLDSHTVLGGAIRLQSRLSPSLSGDYAIFKLGFEIANRDNPFYWIAETTRV